jgi:hypothetical protein
MTVAAKMAGLDLESSAREVADLREQVLSLAQNADRKSAATEAVVIGIRRANKQRYIQQEDITYINQICEAVLANDVSLINQRLVAPIGVIHERVRVLLDKHQQDWETGITQAMALGLDIAREALTRNGVSGRQMLLVRARLLKTYLGDSDVDLKEGSGHRHPHSFVKFTDLDGDLTKERNEQNWYCDACFFSYDGLHDRFVCAKGCNVDLCKGCFWLVENLTPD